LIRFAGHYQNSASPIPLEALREPMNRADVEPIDVTPAQEGGRLLSNRKVNEDS
jgi:hypothetical protein